MEKFIALATFTLSEEGKNGNPKNEMAFNFKNFKQIIGTFLILVHKG